MLAASLDLQVDKVFEEKTTSTSLAPQKHPRQVTEASIEFLNVRIFSKTRD